MALCYINVKSLLRKAGYEEAGPHFFDYFNIC